MTIVLDFKTKLPNVTLNGGRVQYYEGIEAWQWLWKQQEEAMGEKAPPVRMTLEDLEEWHIRRVIAATSTFKEATEILGVSKKTLWIKRKEYGMEISDIS